MLEKLPTNEFKKLICDLMGGVGIEDASESLVRANGHTRAYTDTNGFPYSFKEYMKRNEAFFQLCVLARAFYLQSQVAYAYPKERAYHNYMLLCQACEEIVDFLTDSEQEKDDPGFLRRLIDSLHVFKRKNS